MGDNTVFTVEGDATADAVIDEARKHGARIVAVTPRRESLEDLFVRKALVSGG
jgi:ABC-2 type transport system ATP-binding protein